MYASTIPGKKNVGLKDSAEYRGVFRTVSNIYDGPFLRKQVFAKNSHLRFCFWLTFTPRMDEEPLEGMELQENVKERRDVGNRI